MSYHSPAGGNDSRGADQAAPADTAAGIDRMLRSLQQEALALGIPLCSRLITAARQDIAERLGETG